MRDVREELEKVISNFVRTKMFIDPAIPRDRHGELVLTLTRIIYDVVYPHLKSSGDTR